MGAVIAVLAFLIVFGVLPILQAEKIAKAKGQTGGWIWGLALSWIGVLIVSAQSNPQEFSIQQIVPAAPTPRHPCPQCAELIQRESKVCPYCCSSLI